MFIYRRAAIAGVSVKAYRAYRQTVTVYYIITLSFCQATLFLEMNFCVLHNYFSLDKAYFASF
jgi:hypothetical protein